LSLGKRREFQRLVSAGGVIARKTDDTFEVALIFNNGLWLLPKGLVEEDETFEETAVREVKEETGLAGEIIEKVGEINYAFSRDRFFFKTVHFYLLRYVGGSVGTHDSEADDVRWFAISEAAQLLAYPNEQRIVVEAERRLRK
jgi:8-oxo-dGTP pyrophosphatase MutT (NUDIX family)